MFEYKFYLAVATVGLTATLSLFADNSSNKVLQDRALLSKNKISKNSSDHSDRPNILFFMVDEQRFTTEYESDELKKWKKKNLVFQNMLASEGVVFNNHYTNTNACAPSRTTLQTGQFPNVHGVTQTDGIAKSADSPDMKW